MTAPVATRGRTRVCRVRIGRVQAQCSCGWRGPDRYIEAVARIDQQHHKTAGVHRGIHAGAWFQQQQWGAITDIKAEDRTLVFDPPNVIWPAGGQRIRVEDFDTDRPILAVEQFDREIHRFAMRPESTP